MYCGAFLYGLIVIQYSEFVYRFKFHKSTYIKSWKVFFARLNPLLLTSVLTIKKSKKFMKKIKKCSISNWESWDMGSISNYLHQYKHKMVNAERY